MPLSADHLAVLACPLCEGVLSADGRSVACAQGHSFDVARQGHVQLSAAPIRHQGDSMAMLQARQRVQAAGLHDGIRAAIAGSVQAHHPAATPVEGVGCVVDVGAGTGGHLAALLAVLPSATIGLALDSSKAAGRLATRAHDRIGAVVCDVVAGLPLVDGAADVLLSVFAPRNVGEFARTVRLGGLLIVVLPLPDHVVELRLALGLLDIGSDKADQVAAGLAADFALVDRLMVRHQQSVAPGLATDVVMMGPNAFHRTREEVLTAVEAMPEPQVLTHAVTVSTFARR